jgi:TolB protein
VAIFAGLGALGLLLLGGGGLLALSGGGLLASNTATPTHPASATPAVGGALTTDMPAPSPTLEASATPAPTETATAVALIGGGGRIAFVSNREDGATLQIWTMNPDGSDPRQLTFGPGNKAQPRWSPDGQRLLYVAPGGRDDFGNDLGTDLFIMNADGTHSVNLTHNVGDDRDPAWGPTVDIAFTSTRNNNVPLVYLMKVACPGPEEDCTAEKPRSITMTGTYAPEHSPAWAPDGRLAVVANVRGAPGRIYFGGAGGGGTLFDRSDQLLGVDHLEWSPDGAFIALTWTISSGRNEIYLVPVDNPREHAQLTESRGNKEPAFSPDGRWIIFTSTRDQNPEVYLMSSTGGNQQNLSQSPFVDMQPDWSPKP